MLEIVSLEHAKKGSFLFFFLFFLAFLYPIAPALGDESSSISSKPSLPHPALEKGAIYQVSFRGVEDSSLLALLEEVSQLKALESKPPITLEALRYRVMEDLPKLSKVLESQGYYDAVIYPFLQEGVILEKGGKYLVILDIDLGPQYILNSFTIEGKDFSPEVENIINTLKENDIPLGEPAVSQVIVDTETKLLTRLAAHGYPFAVVVSKDIRINELTHYMEVYFILELGPLSYFGEIKIEGLKTLNSSYVEDEIPWKKGEVFSIEKVNQLRQRLMRSGLFASVEVLPAKKGEEGNLVPVTIRLVEGKPRYVGAGARYASSEGSTIKAFWGNKNLFGNGESLELSAQYGRKKSLLETSFSRPHFLRPDQTLRTTVEGGKEITDAYTKKGGSAFIKLERKFLVHWTGSAGIAYDIGRIKSDFGNKAYHLPSFPLEATYSTINNILDPTQGMKINALLTPYPKFLGGEINFLRSLLSAIFHFPLTKKETVIFSSFTGIGFMPKAKRSSVPVDKLFYAGGAGSIRGYGYQLAGPLDSNNNPIGGLSLFEIGGEFLFKVAKDFGFVTFLEGGTVYNRAYPNFSSKLFWGTGAGIRYYTSVGPIRFDIAFPLARRKNVDSPFQIYVGLGQSF